MRYSFTAITAPYCYIIPSMLALNPFNNNKICHGFIRKLLCIHKLYACLAVFLFCPSNHSGSKGWVWGIWRWWDQEEEHQWGCGPQSATWLRYTNAPRAYRGFILVLTSSVVNLFDFHVIWNQTDIAEVQHIYSGWSWYLLDFPLKSKKSLLLTWTP